MLPEAQIDYKRDPKRLVPVHLSDFMGLAKAITEVDLNRVYQAFNPKYLRGSTSKDCIIQYDNKKCVSIHVLDHRSFESPRKFLEEIWFEAGMKEIPTNGVVKWRIAVYDEKDNVEYRTNGIRIFRHSSRADVVAMVEALISRMHPHSTPLKLVQLDICGGLEALSADDMLKPELHYVADDYAIGAGLLDDVAAAGSALLDDAISGS